LRGRNFPKTTEQQLQARRRRLKPKLPRTRDLFNKVSLDLTACYGVV